MDMNAVTFKFNLWSENKVTVTKVSSHLSIILIHDKRGMIEECVGEESGPTFQIYLHESPTKLHAYPAINSASRVKAWPHNNDLPHHFPGQIKTSQAM